MPPSLPLSVCAGRAGGSEAGRVSTVEMKMILASCPCMTRPVVKAACLWTLLHPDCQLVLVRVGGLAGGGEGLERYGRGAAIGSSKARQGEEAGGGGGGG